VQESRSWLPPTGTLGTILDATRRRLPTLDRASDGRITDSSGAVATVDELGRGVRAFAAGLRRDHVAVIAEIKRKSPSKGDLNLGIDASTQAGTYERGGAAAISVLTEPDFFGGSLEDLREVAGRIRLPVLRKDFHIDARQLLDARRAGASAVLLIARALSPTELPQLLQAANTMNLEAIVEVRDDVELERAIDAGAEIIGVNSRNLETLEVDARVPERIVPKVPPHVIAVWESGVSTVADVERAAQFGADAVLVGSALSKSTDPEALVRALSQVTRVGRG